MLASALAGRGARRAPGGLAHAADHAARFPRYRRAQGLRRRGARAAARPPVRQRRTDAGPRPGHHVLVPAAQRAGLELRGGQLSQGQKPPAFDLLFWNGDSTNLPGPFFSWYFRNTYLENNLKVPGRAQAAGLPLDLTRLTMPAYIFGSREDHIVPWTAAYASTQLLRGPQRFVLGASGHIAGVVNPPAKKRRSYWVMERDGGPGNLPGDPNAGWRRPSSSRAAGGRTGAPAGRPFGQAGQGARQIGQCQPSADRAGAWQVREGPGRLRPRSRLVRSR